jgi:hypothetical protein
MVQASHQVRRASPIPCAPWSAPQQPTTHESPKHRFGNPIHLHSAKVVLMEYPLPVVAGEAFPTFPPSEPQPSIARRRLHASRLRCAIVPGDQGNRPTSAVQVPAARPEVVCRHQGSCRFRYRQPHRTTNAAAPSIRASLVPNVHGRSAQMHWRAMAQPHCPPGTRQHRPLCRPSSPRFCKAPPSGMRGDHGGQAAARSCRDWRVSRDRACRLPWERAVLLPPPCGRSCQRQSSSVG